MIWAALIAALAVVDLPCPRLAASGGSTDLYCIELVPAPGFDASGSVELGWIGGPFTVGVARDGTHRWAPRFSLANLPDSLVRGPRAGFVAWVAPPSFAPTLRLGTVRAGTMDAGTITFDRFIVLVTAEPDTTVREPRGRVVLRGESASNRMRPADNYQFFLGAAGMPAPDASSGEHQHHASGDGWGEMPMFPGIDMLPSEMALRPAEAPWRLAPDPRAPAARPREVMAVGNGDSITLEAGVVRRTIGGRDYTMLGFNGQYPGPLIQAKRNTTLTITLVNHLPMPTTVHWHGVRLENRFDGVPDLTQPPVLPGESFTYTLRFPDAGVFWYHPHVREDIQQDLDLYGNIQVDDGDEKVRREHLILDDILVDEAGLVPYGAETPTHAAMGRFGNTLLVNGEPRWQARARPNERVRLVLTNVANTRTFNLSFDGVVMTAVGSDLGRFNAPATIESAVIAPAERYIVDVSFPKPGRYPLVNRVRAIDHLFGRFFQVTDTLGVVEVKGSAARPAAAPRPVPDRSLDSLVRVRVDQPPDHTLELAVAFKDLPFVSLQLMRIDSIYFNPVEWEGTMPGMNGATTGQDTRWILRDPATGAENMDIRWRFRRGTFTHLRLAGVRNTLHGMQHPIHVHGQRFLVLAVNGKRNENPVWKDTVLLPAAGAIDLLVEMSNPGTWMIHCHIAEHLQSQMMMHFDVEES